METGKKVLYTLNPLRSCFSFIPMSTDTIFLGTILLLMWNSFLDSGLISLLFKGSWEVHSSTRFEMQRDGIMALISWYISALAHTNPQLLCLSFHYVPVTHAFSPPAPGNHSNRLNMVFDDMFFQNACFWHTHIFNSYKWVLLHILSFLNYFINTVF